MTRRLEIEPAGPPPDAACPLLPGELSCLNATLRRTTRQLGALYDEALAPTGLKATQFGLLAQIEQAGGEAGAPLHTLAERLALHVSALTHALRPLLRDGLVALRPGAADKRVRQASLTEAGRRKLGEGLRLWAMVNGKVEAALGHDAAAQLRALARRVESAEFRAAYRAAPAPGEAGPPG
ncbi:MarR family transcriptional regulator [Siccirubricoccus sp. KC 17139]|uniref:MarR family transcriptional regulator n=1 Tax=Siccirubricoccus soli TaxID=2899147 RepID=A0ABT1CYY9_9PROT|nr:MarR family transcriptional regulator [Siccirubricoccus soli]MCO6414879.1 MarR family transcriptional regulator [Siccirubricoccus soli]MCP2681009.1 MarR family transcriptional regulator [Siccirubricoccus soli]